MSDFFNYLCYGKGKSIIVLKNAIDKNKYKDDIIKALKTNLSKFYFFEGSKGNYLYNHIKFFENKTIFADILKEILTDYKNLKPSFFAQTIDTLSCFINEGLESIEILNNIYNSMLINTDWANNTDDNIYYMFGHLCIVLFRLCDDEFGKKALKDIKAKKINIYKISEFTLLLLNKDYYYEMNFSNHDYVEDDASEKQYYSYSFKEFLKENNNPAYLMKFKKNAKAKDKKLVVDYILNNYSNQKELIKLFSSIDSDKFSYRVSDIINILINLNPIQKKIVLSYLSLIKSEEILNLGLELINDQEYINYGIVMLLTNYRKTDLITLTNAYKKANYSYEYEEANLFLYTISFIGLHQDEDMTDILSSLYEHPFSPYKPKIIWYMDKFNMLTDEIWEEITYDASIEVREYITNK